MILGVVQGYRLVHPRFILTTVRRGTSAIVVRRADDIFLVFQEACERITWETHIGVDQKQMRVPTIERHLCEVVPVVRAEGAPRSTRVISARVFETALG